MSELIPITSHVFSNNYNNNSGMFGGQGVTINGVKFTDFSFAAKTTQGVYNSLSNQTVPSTLMRLMQANSLDSMNKLLSMMFINWNGAIIKNGNFTTGEDITISTTPEFLAIFNNIATVTYENVYLESKIQNRVGLNVLITKTVNINTPISIVGYPSIKENEVVDVIYENTSSSNIVISITNNSNVGDVTGCKFRVPNPLGLSISVPGNGYAEISFLRIGNTIFARGV